MIALRIAISDETKLVEREKNLSAHKEHLRSGDIMILRSGPFRTPDGSSSGALVMAEVERISDLIAFSDRDSFVIAGVYKDLLFAEWTITLGAP